MNTKKIFALIVCSSFILLTIGTNNPSMNIRHVSNKRKIVEFQDLPTNNISNSITITNSNLKINQIISNNDRTSSIHIDKNNSIYVGGSIQQPDATGNIAFISKLNSKSEILWTKILPDLQSITDIKIDSALNLIFVAETRSTSYEFVGNSLNTTSNGNPKFILQKMDENGDILWNTLWGGSVDNWAAKIVIDSKDNIIMTGLTNSNDFPVNSNAFDNELTDESIFNVEDGFVTKISKDGDLIFSTFLGGSQEETNTKIQIDDNDNIVVIGSTRSTDFPVSENPHQSTLNTLSDAFITKLKPNGEVVFSSYLGGGHFDGGANLAIDQSNNIVVVGSTFSQDFPVLDPEFSESQGSTDGFIAKFSGIGKILWSTYYGGSQDDSINEINIDEDGNLFIAGETQSNDFPHTKSYLDDENSIEERIFLNKINAQGKLVWGLIIGSGEEDETAGLARDNNGNIYHLGNTESELFRTINGYQFTFGGSDSILSKINEETGVISWITRTVVVTDPTLDQDGDNLTNQEEYEIKTNPLSPDTDGDTMQDDWEYLSGLDPTIDDSLEDPDNDRLENVREFNEKTDPFNSDTDNDGMPDGWEFDNFLNPLSDDDKDSDRNDMDGMPALWEYLMGLDPLEVDNSSDKDNDGLTNLFEWEYTGNYTHGLNASNRDTDGDGMIDGWEIENDLDPLKNDAHEDPDNDFLPNDFEHEYGLDPNNRRELYVMLIVIILIISAISYMLLRIQNINNQAKKENFTNLWDKRKSLKAGFETQIERSEAQKLGFLTKEVRDIIIATGLKNAIIMRDTWEQRNKDILNDVDKFDLDISISKIFQTESPRELLIVQNEFGNILEMLKENNIKLNNQIALQDTLLNLIDRSNSNLIVGISRNYIENIRNTSNETSHKMHAIIRSFESEIETRKEWFQPWEALLTLIQITPDEKPISISEIMQVINRSEEHAEDLLIALLKENTKIGSYNNQTKSYTKASNIDRYLEIALAQMKEPDESLKE